MIEVAIGDPFIGIFGASTSEDPQLKILNVFICANISSTPRKINMEPENDCFQKESPFPEADFQVPC